MNTTFIGKTYITKFRRGNNPGTPDHAETYEAYRDVILARLKELGPCILPGGRGQPQITVGAKYTKLKTIKGEWVVIRTGSIDSYREWTHRLIKEYPDKFNTNFVIYQQSLTKDGRGLKYGTEGQEFVYFIGADDLEYVKIGRSKDVYKRLDGIQTSIPHDLKILLMIPGDKKAERAAHIRFEKYRKRGEWFVKAGPIERYINYINNKSGPFLDPWEWEVGEGYGYVNVH